MEHQKHLLVFLFLLSQSFTANSWFFSSKGSTHTENQDKSAISVSAEFSGESINNQGGVELLQNAKNKMLQSNSCWKSAYNNLFDSCARIMADDEKKSRLAWDLGSCFQNETAAPNAFPYCGEKYSMKKCLAKLDQDARKVHLEFYLQTNTICHQLQADAFKRQTERLVNDLKKSAEFAEDKLELIEAKAEDLWQNSNQIHDSLVSIDLQTQQVAKMTQNVEDHVDTVLKHSQAVYIQSKEIAASQLGLAEGQAEMKEKLKQSMDVLRESYNKVVQEITMLKDEAADIEKKIGEVGEAMASKMNMLQNTADDIQNVAATSLDKQKQLLDGQSVALDGLQNLTSFQSKALEESKSTFQQFIELKDKQQDELLQRQQQLQETHDSLVESSNTILEAQKTFESKQASMFIALDKLFSLHNAMLLESRFIKSFIIYCGLFVMAITESVILRYGNSVEQQAWMINWVRMLFGTIALIQYLYAIFTYRDLELLNHNMLRKLADYSNQLQVNKEISVDYDSDVDWSSWVDSDLPEDLSIQEDPDYLLPEGVGKSSGASTTTRYNLRRRLKL